MNITLLGKVISYDKGLSESVARVMKKHSIAVFVRLYHTLREALVHPKDRVEKENACGVVYEFPCLNCELEYMGQRIQHETE